MTADPTGGGDHRDPRDPCEPVAAEHGSESGAAPAPDSPLPGAAPSAPRGDAGAARGREQEPVSPGAFSDAAAPAGRRAFTLGAVGSRSAGPPVTQAPQQVGDAREAAEAASSDSFYAQVGGHATFEKLTREFYARVAEDPDFKALYPEQDLGPAEERLRMFLEQYWGGPTTYSEQRGHPRLRMRHAPFPVDTWARETWLAHMRAAMDTLELSPLHDGIMWDYFDRAAHAMVNRPG